MRKITGFLKLVRFELPLAAGLCVIMGQVLSLGYFAPFALSLIAFLSVFSISASILVLNDYFDIETDKVNAPHRPIPSGLVTEKEALFFSLFLLFLGLSFSLYISLLAFAFSILLSFTGFLYNRHFKKSGLPGNLMVSFSVGMTFVFGGLSLGDPFNKLVLLFAFIAALIDLGEEIAADAMDAEGDKLINSKSVAIMYGKKRAIHLSSVIFSIVVLLTFIPLMFEWFPLIYFIPLLLIDISIIVPVVYLIKNQGENGRNLIRYIYLGSTLGIIIFLVFKLVNI